MSDETETPRLCGVAVHPLAHGTDLLEGEFLRVGVHALGHQHTIEVIELVLEESRRELVGFDGDLVALEVEAHQVDLLRAHDLERHAGDRQAPLLIGPLAAGLDDAGIDQYAWFGAVVGVEVVDEQALSDTHLRGSEAEARSLVHRLEHVVGQLDQPVVDVGDLGRGGPQHGIADHSDAVGSCHGTEATVGSLSTPPGQDDHYFSASPTSASRPGTVRMRLRGLDVDLESDRGTFSPGRIDPGTRFLLESAPEPPAGGRLLDLGCGYGPIAVTLALLAPTAEVLAVDVNERSRGLTARNADAVGARNITVTAPDETPEGAFDLIWSNPPIRIGKSALHDLLGEWLSRLSASGSAVLVVNRHLGADSLQRWLTEQGFPTERLASKKGYRLLRSTPG